MKAKETKKEERDLHAELEAKRKGDLEGFNRDLEALLKRYDVSLKPGVILHGNQMEWQIKVVNNK